MPITSEQEQRYEKEIAAFTMMDDLFLRTMLDGCTDAAEEILRPIIGKEVKLTDVFTQYSLDNLIGRSAVLDVFAYQGEEIKKIQIGINMEADNRMENANPKRPRYHAALIDTELTSKGLKWSELPEILIIMFCKNDYYKTGRPLYHIGRTIEETGEVFGDQEQIIYVNGSYQNTDTEIGRLIHDFKCADPDKMYYPKIAQRVRETKTGRKEKQLMCEAMEREFQLGEKRGIEIGEKRTRENFLKTVKKLVSENRLSIEEAVKDFQITAQEQQKLFGS